MSDLSFLAGMPGLSGKGLDDLGSVFECITSNLTDNERQSFGVELLDTVRNDATNFSHVLGAWIVTSQIRTHPDYEVQTKEFDNLVSSGDILLGMEKTAQLG